MRAANCAASGVHAASRVSGASDVRVVRVVRAVRGVSGVSGVNAMTTPHLMDLRDGHAGAARDVHHSVVRPDGPEVGAGVV